MSMLHNVTNVHGQQTALLKFSIIDYILFTIILILSALIGVYFGFGKKQPSKTEYMHGGKKMKIGPVTMSLIAGHFSGIAWLGVPSEIYTYGSQYFVCTIAAVILAILTMQIFLPVFHKLQHASVYEYLSKRFNSKVRSFASFMYCLNTFFIIPVVMYVPALTFNEVTGLSIYIAAPIVCLVCIFYTTLGGFKAVVWTDALQLTVTLAAMGSVLVMGTIFAGGFAKVWKTAEYGGRTEIFNLDYNPTSRTTFWAIVLGLTVTWLSVLGCSQTSVQRFLSVPTLKDAKKTVIYFAIGVIIAKLISSFSGLIIYARYFDCDPLSAGIIRRPDQLMPYFVMDVARNIYGLPGLFVAGVFCAALSTMSASLNTLAGTVYEDFISQHLSEKSKEKVASKIMKASVVVIGLACLALIFLVDKLGMLFQLTMSLISIANGPLLGLFSLGMLFPFVNSKGALYGGVGGLALITWIAMGAEYHIMSRTLKYPTKNMTTDGCNAFNATSRLTNTTARKISSGNTAEVFWVYRISFYYYTLIGAVAVVIFGLIVSCLTRSDDHRPVDPDLLSPVIHRFLKKREESESKSSEKKNVIIT